MKNHQMPVHVIDVDFHKGSPNSIALRIDARVFSGLCPMAPR